MQQADLASDLKAVGRLGFWSILLMKPGGPLYALPVFAVLGIVRFRRLRTHAPDPRTRVALSLLLALAVATGLLALASLIPGQDPDTSSSLAMLAFVAGCLAWAVAMARWTGHLGLAHSARRYRRAGQAFATAFTVQAASLALVLAFVDEGPPRDGFVSVRPEQFLGRPLGLPAAFVAFVLAGVAFFTGMVLLTQASTAFRNALGTTGPRPANPALRAATSS